MPELSEIEYSQEACCAAVRDFYRFLTTMYLDGSKIIEPSEGGWSIITADLLDEDDDALIECTPWCSFVDWKSKSDSIALGGGSMKFLKSCTESPDYTDNVPPTVNGLTSGRHDQDVFLLDIERGIIYWPECPDEIKHYTKIEPVLDDPDDYAPENEVEWRSRGPAWAISDFFEVLKDQFRELNFVPVNTTEVMQGFEDNFKGKVPMVQDIYRKYEWPDLERYQKKACLEAVEAALQEWNARVYGR